MKICITEKDGEMTVKELLRNRLGLSGSLIKELKKAEDGIVLNGKRVTVREPLTAGDELCLALERELDEKSTVIPQKGDCTLLYEDGGVIAFSKPSGMPTHPSRGHLTDTLANAAAYIFAERGIPFTFRAASRLDNDVSGIVLCAANKMCSKRLSDEMSARRIDKTYLALCDGAPMKKGTKGTLEGYIRRCGTSIITREMCEAGDGAHAITEYEVLAENGSRTLMAVKPITGRTHQIRLAMRALGCPISGDGFYGNEETAPRCMLHALKIGFRHPLTDTFTVLSAPVYPDMEALITENFGDISYGDE
ncbi:MAG: RluA family pseudouridine synthase [Clostridia bacterium]|nr:RluA family pseudouridine synthase [Clostridia bacterium]